MFNFIAGHTHASCLVHLWKSHHDDGEDVQNHPSEFYVDV
jgi:hypothetical protein